MDTVNWDSLRHAVALVCKEYYSLVEIDGLFLASGCRKEWFRPQDDAETSERMRCALGWFDGIGLFAGRSRFDIARNVAIRILSNQNIESGRKYNIAAAIGKDWQQDQTEKPDWLRLNLHPKIIEAARELMDDGYYRQAISQTYVSLVSSVKEKSGRLDLDNSPLMQQVFSKNDPLLRCSSDPDEQLGFMWLFSGAVMAIRNPRAHKMSDETDKNVDRALEWLAFASALFRILDDAEVVA